MTYPAAMKTVRIALCALLALPFASCAEDIDLFVGGAGNTASANVLIILDNTKANWNQASQHWPGGIAQGQAELLAIKTVVGTLNDSVNVGLMMFADNGANSGEYIRYAMRPMTTANRANLQTLLQTIYTNFATSGTTTPGNYSAALFDGFKYFGGYTSPAHARDNIAGTPQNSSAFGPAVYAGAPASYAAADTAAYTSSALTTYVPPAAAADACGGKNYVVFIGNGYPTPDTAATVLSGAGGNTTQLAMPVLTPSSVPSNTSIGYSAACYASTGTGQSSCTTANASTCGAAYDSCACAAPITTTGCTGGQVKWTVVGALTTTTATPTGAYSVPTGSAIRYTDEWARYLYQTDANAATGQQNITTYAIDVFNSKQNKDQTALLYSMAAAGGGKYFAAKTQAQIEGALGSAFAEIQGANSTFASAALPLSATNRAVNANEVYIGMFRPDQAAQPVWFGNLKRYKIASFNGDLKLADVNGNDAVNTLTGFVTDCATSWWTSDTGAYWASLAINPSPAGLCSAPNTTFGPWSDAPDGPRVEKGSVGEVLRQGNAPSSAPTWALNRSVYTKAFATFNTTNTGMASADVDFVRGLNVDANGYTQTYSFNDGGSAAQTTSVRPTIHGDVVHSRPLPVSYGGTTGTVLFYGANDGTYRAVDASNGRELWAYVAPEHYAILPRLRQNSPLISYPFLSSLNISPAPQAKPYMWDGNTGLYQNADNSQVWIFPTMRRGGRMIYTFDVTNPAAPSLKWKVGCPNIGNDTGCTTGMTGIGQTWSTPMAANLTGVGPVLAVGGGYDACEDGAPSAACAGAKGNAVYLLDASTGAVLASFATLGRVVADIAFADVDGDGNPDYAYAADTRGNLYRITLGTDSANWSLVRIAYTTGANRKFLHAPAVVPVRDQSNGTSYVYLALGSGDREQPLETQYPYATAVQNRFYVFLDNLIGTPVATNLDNATVLTNNTVSTTCGSPASLPGASRGWFMDLTAGTGEQTVTSAVVVGGVAMFSTNRAIPRSANVCTPLGEARGYAVNLFNASGAIGTSGVACGGGRSSVFVGGGLPPSPVIANVQIDANRVATVVIGAPNLQGGASVPIQSQSAFTLPKQKRTRVWWRREGVD